MVVFVEEELQFEEVVGAWAVGEPFLHCLSEAFDFALGLWVEGVAVLLLDPEAGEVVFKAVLAASAGGPGREDHAVVGEY